MVLYFLARDLCLLDDELSWAPAFPDSPLLMGVRGSPVTSALPEAIALPDTPAWESWTSSELSNWPSFLPSRVGMCVCWEEGVKGNIQKVTTIWLELNEMGAVLTVMM